MLQFSYYVLWFRFCFSVMGFHVIHKSLYWMSRQTICLETFFLISNVHSCDLTKINRWMLMLLVSCYNVCLIFFWKIVTHSPYRNVWSLKSIQTWNQRFWQNLHFYWPVSFPTQRKKDFRNMCNRMMIKM